MDEPRQPPARARAHLCRLIEQPVAAEPDARGRARFDLFADRDVPAAAPARPDPEAG